ncbi:MAG: GTPase Obg [bacterium ADurb.Bin212]|nr:MAG: GTPase Obg [bacterium ADurb.Bin212]
MIIDEAKITIKAGDGGDGGIFFRHEKYVPKGGPDGGDGGNGGNVFIKASRHIDDLTEYVRKRKIFAEDGQNGMKQKMFGKKGQDLILNVPLGTQVYENNQLLFDLTEDEKKILIAKGGSGGWGNCHFATSIKQAPEWAKEGLPGEKKKIRLELKMIADVGLVGLPNAGKSTLLSVISNARPKVADYPFTTIEPNLGVVRAENRSIIVADIPGLIEGASDGKGLGTKFLKHIERTRTILHLVDVSGLDPWRDYHTVRDELKKFSEKLAKKPELVVLSKIELIPDKEIKKIVNKFKKHKINTILISAATHSGIDALIYDIIKHIS